MCHSPLSSCATVISAAEALVPKLYGAPLSRYMEPAQGLKIHKQKYSDSESDSRSSGSTVELSLKYKKLPLPPDESDQPPLQRANGMVKRPALAADGVMMKMTLHLVWSNLKRKNFHQRSQNKRMLHPNSYVLEACEDKMQHTGELLEMIPLLEIILILNGLAYTPSLVRRGDKKQTCLRNTLLIFTPALGRCPYNITYWCSKLAKAYREETLVTVIAFAQTMDKVVKECMVCQTTWDNKRHQPVALPACGHSFCRHCLIKLRNVKEVVECPICRKVLVDLLPEDLPVNWALLQSVDPSPNMEFEEWARASGLTDSTIKKLVSEDLNSRVALKLLNGNDIFELGLTIGQRKILMAIVEELQEPETRKDTQKAPSDGKKQQSSDNNMPLKKEDPEGEDPKSDKKNDVAKKIIIGTAVGGLVGVGAVVAAPFALAVLKQR
ncbi:hypothetical protein O3P69_016863 [Scylla paramamosain]|uniref:RING-type domain-containing protein n=1 Tax=Scylla paramamosain TaxID=85552 RepID=A0AAW0SYM8_SCYPA